MSDVTVTAAAAQRLAVLAPDGPDEMGRELFGGPESVRAALAGLAPALPGLRAGLSRARRAVLVGTGASLAMARTVAPPWRAWGSEVLVRESSAVVFDGTDGMVFGRDDCAVVISKSGSSPETLAACRLAGDAGAHVVAVTAERESELARDADEVIWTPIGEEHGAATKSELSALAVLLALGGVLEPAEADGLASRLAAIAADWAWAAELGPRLAAAPYLWILGFGATEGVAEAGALMWHEKVHRPAVATTPSEFRHGPIESATAADAVVLVERLGAADAERRYLDLLDVELGTLGTPLVRVAPPADREGYRILATLLRLQQLARATAHAAGTYRDGFAILRQVVSAASL